MIDRGPSDHRLDQQAALGAEYSFLFVTANNIHWLSAANAEPACQSSPLFIYSCNYKFRKLPYLCANKSDRLSVRFHCLPSEVSFFGVTKYLISAAETDTAQRGGKREREREREKGRWMRRQAISLGNGFNFNSKERGLIQCRHREHCRQKDLR